VTAGRESGSHDTAVIGGGPGCLLAVLHDDGVSGEERGYDGPEEVVEWVAICYQQVMFTVRATFARWRSGKRKTLSYFQLTQAATTPSGS